MPAFEPDAITLRLLQAEHVNGTWVGAELLPIASRIRDGGGDEDDYLRWVTSSAMWGSYTGSTSDPESAHRKHLASAWDKAEESKPFDLDDALSDLEDRIRRARWKGRAGGRNRSVALAFVGFCRDRNCFTRTISTYELAKYTRGLAPRTVARGLADLVTSGLLARIDRTDRRVSDRSTGRYQINLRWRPVGSLAAPPDAACPNGISDSRSTGKASLRQLCRSDRDIWSSRGLGQTAGRIYEVLADEPATVRELSDRTGLSERATRDAVARLAEHCLAGFHTGRPTRYFLVETPLHAVAEAIGASGHVDHYIEKIERRQRANRQAYPSTYTNHQTQEGTTE